MIRLVREESKSEQAIKFSPSLPLISILVKGAAVCDLLSHHFESKNNQRVLDRSFNKAGRFMAGVSILTVLLAPLTAHQNDGTHLEMYMLSLVPLIGCKITDGKITCFRYSGCYAVACRIYA
jgi:hypothetical protein